MSDTAPSHQLNLPKPYLKLIADGIKTVEVRVGYPKMRRIQAGHELTFASGGDTVVTRVNRVAEYDSFEGSCSATFEALLGHEDAVVIGGDLGESRDELLAVIREIYPPEKEELGVLETTSGRVPLPAATARAGHAE